MPVGALLLKSQQPNQRTYSQNRQNNKNDMAPPLLSCSSTLTPVSSYKRSLSFKAALEVFFFLVFYLRIFFNSQ